MSETTNPAVGGQVERRVSRLAHWPFADQPAPTERRQATAEKPLTAKTLTGRHAQRMKRLALDRARWEKRNGPAWRHKRERAVRDCLAYRKVQHRAG